MKLQGQVALVVMLVAVAVTAAAQQPAADPVAAMLSGRELFEKSCKLCHGLDRALTPARDAAQWEKIVKRMVTYGAPLNAEQRPLVTRYLATQSAFAQKCAACHEATRVVGDAPGPRDWKALAECMAAHARELERQGKAAAAGGLTPEELTDIAALLQVLIP
ncbi:MAG TPA: cytochrome c [Candidatus Methanoperedens sp.]|nr:cytochrome c [Candidatus Methanoperedens sp.]